MTETTEAASNDTQVKTPAAFPIKDDSSIFSKDYRDYLAYQVSEDAKQKLLAWAKWIIGVVALMIAVLGVKTYFDVQRQISKAIDSELVVAREKTEQAIGKFTTETETALKNLEMETARASELISAQTTQASQKIALIVGGLPTYVVPPPISGLTRFIYDAQHKETLPGVLVRKEGDPPSSDETVNEVYENVGVIYGFFKNVLHVSFTPDEGKITITVHYGQRYDNRFWNGTEVVVGDGDGEVFTKFSGLNSIAGALAHFVIGKKTRLRYLDQQGALAYHLSDVISVMAVQWHENQTSTSATWLIGSDMLSSKIKGSALRSMKAPGSAYDDPKLGKDPQPAHMKDYIKTNEDNGGVHVNSGIPNHAFYLAAVEVGSFSWDRIGKIWINSLDHTTEKTDFEDFAIITSRTAENLYGNDSDEAKAVAKAWSEVGIDVHRRQTGTYTAKAPIKPQKRGPKSQLVQ
jgi:Zn-dependent metalloprotease